MKLSLNSQQKDSIVLLDTFQFTLEQALAEWAQSKTMSTYKDALKAFRMANTWMSKGLSLIIKNVDAKEAAALDRRKETNEIVLMPKGDFERLRKQQPDLKYWMNKEQAFYLAEGVIEAFCRNCKRKPGECEIRALMQAWEVPGIVGQYEECQYREKGGEGFGRKGGSRTV